MKIRYHSVCSDLDNTLLMPDKTLSEETQRVISRLIDEGVNVIPCTGRAFWSIPDCVLNYPGLKYAIVSNGAAIYDLETKEPVLSLTLDEKFAGDLLHFLRERGEYVTYECFVKGQAYTSQRYFEDPSYFGIPGERERFYVQSTRIPVPDIEEFVLAHAGDLDALDVILMPEDKDRVLKDIANNFEDVYLTSSVEHLIEISNENSGKHKGMEALMEYLNQDMEGIIAFGDGDNDQEMLKHAGLGIAVDNATEKCKAAADQVIGRFDEEAVASFLKEIYQI